MGCAQQNPATDTALGLNESAAIHELPIYPKIRYCSTALRAAFNPKMVPCPRSMAIPSRTTMPYKGSRQLPCRSGTVLRHLAIGSRQTMVWRQCPSVDQNSRAVKFSNENKVQYALYRGNKRESEISSSEMRINLIKNMKIATSVE
jgi:hypothetical protein